MSMSEKLGKAMGKVVKGATAAPEATSNKTAEILADFRQGFRAVVPEKPKNQE